MLCIIWILSNLLRLDLWLKIWSILEKIHCVLERSVYSAIISWNVLQKPVRSNDWQYYSSVLCSCFLLTCFLIMEGRCRKLYWWIFLFLLAILSVFASCSLKLCCPCLNIKDFYDLLMNWPLYLLSSDLCSAAYFVWII